MNSVTSKVSYLSGFVDGLEIDKTTKEGKAITQIVEALKQISLEIEDISENQRELEEYLDDIDEDLAYVEDELYDIEDDYDEEEDYDDFVEMKCEKCGEVVYVDAGILEDGEEITCPNCHGAISIEK
jgi:DNA-directed RNA polymerase subunit delta